MFKKGLEDAGQFDISKRREILIKLRQKAFDKDSVKKILEDFLRLPYFKSILDEYEYLLGFILGISYLTRKDIESELNRLKRLLNITNISNLGQYYIAANRYFDKSYGKERIVVSLTPKKGSFAKAKTRVPEVRDFNELKKIVEEFRDLYDLYEQIEDRKYRFFEKIL